MKHAYIMAASCIMFMSVMLIIAAINHTDTNNQLRQQNDKVMQLKADSVRMSRDIRHLTQWHEQSTPEQQREFINNDKIRRVK